MTVVHIEFDKALFNDDTACNKWLRGSEFKTLPELKGFKLRPNARSIFISKENRKVFSWTSDAWKYDRLHIIRPDPHIYVMVADGNPTFSVSDIPALSAKTLKAEQKMLEKQDKKDKAITERRKKLSDDRKKRAEEKKLREMNETKEEREARLLKEDDERRRKKLEREEKKKRKRGEVPFQLRKSKKKIKSEPLLQESGDLDLETAENATKAIKKVDTLGKFSEEVLQEVAYPEVEQT